MESFELETMESQEGFDDWHKEFTQRIRKNKRAKNLLLDFSIFTKDKNEETLAKTGQIKKISIKTIEEQFPGLMTHPLVESFLYMKWSIAKKIVL